MICTQEYLDAVKEIGRLKERIKELEDIVAKHASEQLIREREESETRDRQANFGFFSGNM